MVRNRWFQMKWRPVLLDVGLEWSQLTRWSCQIRVSLYLVPGVYKDQGTHTRRAHDRGRSHWATSRGRKKQEGPCLGNSGGCTLVSDSRLSNPKRTISVAVCGGSHKHGDSLKVFLLGNGLHTPICDSTHLRHWHPAYCKKLRETSNMVTVM